VRWRLEAVPTALDLKDILLFTSLGYIFAWAGCFLINLVRIPALLDGDKERELSSRTAIIEGFTKRLTLSAESLLAEMESNYDDLQRESAAYTWRDEVWRSLNADSFPLEASLHAMICEFYTQLRKGKDAFNSFSQNSARRTATAPYRDAAMKLAAQIIPELQALVSTSRQQMSHDASLTKKGNSLNA
jgi:hypothetical protein